MGPRASLDGCGKSRPPPSRIVGEVKTVVSIYYSGPPYALSAKIFCYKAVLL